MVSTGCAHRRAGAVRLGAPLPPPRTQTDDPSEHLKRADDALERLRDQLQRRPQDRASRGTDPAAPRPTDAAEPNPPPLGPTWSVVTSQRPPANGSEPSQSRLRMAEASNADDDADGHHRADFVGGAIAALCATLAIRKRVRESRGLESPTAQ
jgi:hypothetical protein